jgi:hypothetical protein
MAAPVRKLLDRRKKNIHIYIFLILNFRRVLNIVQGDPKNRELLENPNM